MKRRTFIQSVIGAISSLTFVKSNKGESVKSKEIKPGLLPPDKHFPYNGTVWTAPNHLTVIVLFGVVKNGEWGYCLISPPYSRCIGLKAEDGRIEGTASMVCHLNHTQDYDGFYTEEQLRQKLSTWKRRPELELRLFNQQTERVLYYG